MINARIDERGNLRLTASNVGRQDLHAEHASLGYYAAENMVAEALHEQFTFVAPELLAALTDAPILVDADGVDYPDSGDIEVNADAKVFWFPDYAVTDPWQVLYRTGRVTFTKAENAS